MVGPNDGMDLMAAVETRKRTRLAPQVRRSLILDDAARLILEEGLTAVSMERLGRESEVSKALVYNYFPSREFLLAALLQREQSDLDSRGAARALEAQSYEELIRQTTRVYLEHTKARGALIQALLADPSVVRLMEAFTSMAGKIPCSACRRDSTTCPSRMARAVSTIGSLVVSSPSARIV